MSRLPRCHYPTASDLAEHGVYNLPEKLPLVDFNRALPYRSHKYATKTLQGFSKSKIVELAHLVAQSFAINEPMNRHVHIPAQMPEEIVEALHQDSFGKDAFGPWTKENIMFWFIRLALLTHPTDAQGAIGLNEDLLKLSLIITNEEDQPIGGSLNITLPAEEGVWRKDDAFLHATFMYQNPIINFIHEHEHEAIHALNEQYPEFEQALRAGKVGYIAMIARSAELPTEDTFELFVASFELFQKHGYEFMLITGTNQWTGAACEVLDSARIYFAPFRDQQRVATTVESNESHSNDGYISAKDSGLMVYAVKI